MKDSEHDSSCLPSVTDLPSTNQHGTLSEELNRDCISVLWDFWECIRVQGLNSPKLRWNHFFSLFGLKGISSHSAACLSERTIFDAVFRIHLFSSLPQVPHSPKLPN